MDDLRDAAGGSARLRRPAVHPDIPWRDRVLLTAPGTFLTPAYWDRPPGTGTSCPPIPTSAGQRSTERSSA
jgi:hypothetical protein